MAQEYFDVKDILDPKAVTVGGFLADNNLRKVVPRYQRPYEWEKEDVNNFLNDINFAINQGADSYFIGAMLSIKRKGDEEYYEVVDGQQRLITLSLVFLVALHLIEENSDSDLEEQLEVSPENFKKELREFLYCKVGRFERKDNDFLHKLEVSENDQLTYKSFVESGPQSSKNHKNRNFIEAYNAIKSFFEEPGVSIAAGIKDFVSFVEKKVLLVSIIISDEANAYEIFEVLNARSKRLEEVDLIKNKLLACISEGTDDELQTGYERWQKVFLACKQRSELMQQYVRCHLQMREGELVPPKYLYKTLKFHAINQQKQTKAYCQGFPKTT